MWSIEAVIARHEAGLGITASERVVMEESTEASATARGVAPGAGGAEAARAAGTMKVVVAVDASEESLHALSWALDNVVRHHPGASVVVLHAQHRVDHFVAHGRSRPGLRPADGVGLHEEGAGGELPEGGGPRAGRVQAEAGERHGGGGGGRPQGGHLPGRGGDARRPARPRQPRPGHDQEGVAGQRERLPRPSRLLPRPHRQATQQGAPQV
uniref:UspA domain-containing protein n=1 Tax=Aegilops tauschii subsp. strangulata TaxID=200361 RepID=A0A453LTK1_AEGTS